MMTLSPRLFVCGTAEAAKLPDGHHVELLADHYSGVVYLPLIIQEIRRKMDD